MLLTLYKIDTTNQTYGLQLNLLILMEKRALHTSVRIFTISIWQLWVKPKSVWRLVIEKEPAHIEIVLTFCSSFYKDVLEILYG